MINFDFKKQSKGVKKVLVIVVTYNGMQWVERCLKSIEKSSVGADAIVIDNGSSDGTVNFIKEEFPKFRLVENGGNLGFGAANNIGMKLAIDRGYEYAYLLNQDAWLERDTLERLIDCHRKEFGILSPVQEDAKGRLDRQFKKKCGKQLREAEKLVKDEKRIVEVPFVMAAHWLLSREAIKTVGGFSPAFTQYGEDDNYIDRLHYFGLKCGVVPSAKAVHDRGERKPSREQRMKLKCISVVVKQSSPSRNFFLRRLFNPLILLGMSLKNFSLAPLRFLLTLRSRYPELRRLRKETKHRGAFI